MKRSKSYHSLFYDTGPNFSWCLCRSID